ncbi:MAG TPA: hypothetical protein VE011_02655 [Candidatus Dormibacteraeota bacterium]|nr:hypothetical protein [Candidatus Dormibacteraeota bacterium]
MPRSAFAAIAWVLAGAFFIGAVLFLLDRLNVVATPPTLPDTANLVDRIVGSYAYRSAIWPVFLGTNVLFAIGFAAIVPFAGMLGAASHAAGVGRWSAVGLLVVGGVLGALASLMIAGAVAVTIEVPYCDCGFKETEVVSQSWALNLFTGAHDWLVRGAWLSSGLGLLAAVPLLPSKASANLRFMTQLTGLAAVLAVAIQLLGVLDALNDVLTGLSAGILVPIWAVWTARTVSATATPDGAGGNG